MFLLALYIDTILYLSSTAPVTLIYLSKGHLPRLVVRSPSFSHTVRKYLSPVTHVRYVYKLPASFPWHNNQVGKWSNDLQDNNGRSHRSVYPQVASDKVCLTHEARV